MQITTSTVQLAENEKPEKARETREEKSAFYDNCDFALHRRTRLGQEIISTQHQQSKTTTGCWSSKNGVLILSFTKQSEGLNMSAILRSLENKYIWFFAYVKIALLVL